MKMFVLLLVVLAASGVKASSINQETNSVLDIGSGPYSFTDCATLSSDLGFQQGLTCIARGRLNSGCVFTRDLMIDNLGTLWDQFCASPSATPSTSPDASFPVQACECIEFETLKPNVFCLNDMEASTDSEGLVIVKGDATFKNGFSIGNVDSNGNRYNGTMLIVGGDLKFLRGSVVGNIEVSGSTNVGKTITNADSNVTSNPTFDFDGSAQHFLDLTDKLCNMPDTGTVTREGVILTTLRGNAATEVFTLNLSDMIGATVLDLSGISASASVVINVEGVNVKFGLNVITPNGSNVVFNFCNATAVSFKNILIDGSLIAPRASVVGTGGVVKGQIVAGYFSGSTQFNDVECNACI